MAISIQEHSSKIASKVVATFQEDIPVREGFGPFFPRETTITRDVDIEVERDNDFIAVDVQRFTEGNKNKSTKVSEKKYQPPYYKEDYNFSEDEVFMSTVGMGIMNSVGANRAIAQNGIKNVRKNRKKIERAIRKQYADVLQTGVVVLKNGDSIDYKRKAASMVDVGAGNYWDDATADIKGQLATAMRFLRDEGNSTGGTVNIVMRGKAMDALLGNTALKTELDNRRIDRGSIIAPQFNETTGFAFQGQITAGDFRANLWTYNEKYTDPSDNSTKYYLDEDNVVLLPEDFRGKTVFAGLITLQSVNEGGEMIDIPQAVEAEYLLRNYSDKKTVSSVLELTSAPLAVPVTVDKIYTLKVFGAGN